MHTGKTSRPKIRLMARKISRRKSRKLCITKYWEKLTIYYQETLAVAATETTRARLPMFTNWKNTSYDLILVVKCRYRLMHPGSPTRSTMTQLSPLSLGSPSTTFELDWARFPSRLPSKQAIDVKSLSVGPCKVTCMDLAIIRKVVEVKLLTILFVTFFTCCC